MARREISYYKHDRIFYHFNDLEEYHAGFWRITNGEQRARHVVNAAVFMANVEEFKNAMLSALDEWPNSCEHNLSAGNTNRLAWLGQAACCVAIGSPEDCTRKAWHILTPAQKDKANAAAREVIGQWDVARAGQLLDLFLEAVDGP